MSLDLIIVVILSLVIGALLGTLLAVTKMHNKQLTELTRALIAKNLTDLTVNAPEAPKEEVEEEEPDIIPVEEMTDSEFDRQIKEQLNG